MTHKSEVDHKTYSYLAFTVNEHDREIGDEEKQALVERGWEFIGHSIVILDVIKYSFRKPKL